MINSSEEFARIWKKEPAELTQLDYFTFLVIKELNERLCKKYIGFKSSPGGFQLEENHISELTVQVADGIQFFYEQMCFGKGCSLGCPNKLGKTFTKNENEIVGEIIRTEFDGNAEACKTRQDCLQHDLMNYVVKDTLVDFYAYDLNLEITEEDPDLLKMASFITGIIIRFTAKEGVDLLQRPYEKAPSFN